jgi:AAA+ ATPase superfamily predicted ATPase
MQLQFVNREPELRELEAATRKGGLLLVYGRRRIGKTRLLRHWLQTRDGLYSQAIEAQRDLPSIGQFGNPIDNLSNLAS